MIARLVGSMDADADEKSAALRRATIGWTDFASAAGDSFSTAISAIRYVPDPDAFFQGSDPFSLIASLPQLLIVDLALTDQTISLETMNAFNCDLEILALTKAPIAEVRTALLNVADRIEIRQLLAPSVKDDEDYSTPAKSLLEAQIVLLRENVADGLLGRLSSAGRTAVSALRYLGSNESAAEVELATATAQAQHDVEPLILAIERALERRTKDGSSANRARGPGRNTPRLAGRHGPDRRPREAYRRIDCGKECPRARGKANWGQ